MRRRRFLSLAGSAGASLLASPAILRAQGAWPDRPVRFIVSFAPGGATDLVARPWVEVLSKAFNQQFVIENRGGASGLIGGEAAFRAAPDGYTFLFTGNTTTVSMPSLRKMSFDPRQFVPVARVGDAVSGFVIHPKVGPKTFAEMIEYARKNPGQLNFGSSGPGTSPHLRLEMLKYKTGIDIHHIPYRGGADSLQDLLAGNIQLMNEASTLPHAKAGKIVLLNVNQPKRFPAFPDVPTLAELGITGADMPTWFALYAPPGTPAAIVAKLNARINEISAMPEWAEKMQLASAYPVVQTPEEMASFWNEDFVKTAEVIKLANIKLE